MHNGTVAAIDLGATSGRVMLGHVRDGHVALEQVTRFPNIPVHTLDEMHWNISGIYRSVVEGLVQAKHLAPDLLSIGIDSWAIDYGLVRDGQLLGVPFHYRDSRSALGVASVHELIPFTELYAENGIQFLPFNTCYQLAAEGISGTLQLTDHVLLIPDLISHWLTGEYVAERTNASTTGLLRLGPNAGWNDALIERLGLPRRVFPSIVEPGERIGTLLAGVAAATGIDASTPVVAVGSHDTASAVVAIPMTDPNSAYISCGTWGLVGVELAYPVLTEASRTANFTNEAGVDGRVRFLHNVMGTWLLSESIRGWEKEGLTLDLTSLLAAATAVTSPVAIFDANDPRFMDPGDVPARIVEWCSERGLHAPRTPAEFVRSILESLAVAFAHAVRTASNLSGKTVNIVHIVGGGSQNSLLCQLTANYLGTPLVAGPVEATALGNVLIQGRAAGLIDGTLEDLRAIVAHSSVSTRYFPQPCRRTRKAPPW